ncbi:MAG: hypothetical protein RI883_1844 [Bacteroidota bacterium]|jgi:hypothetical protein
MSKIKLLKSLVPILLLIVVSYISYRFYLKDIYWNNQTQTLQIDQNSDSRIIEIKKHSEQNLPYSLEIEIDGNTEENTIVLFGTSPTEMSRQIMLKEGKIQFETGSDWYQDNCFILVHSETNRRFKLNVNYRFITSSY